MVASLIIVGTSVALFVFWFRYACALMLSTKTTQNYSQGVARANRLSFLDVPKDMSETDYSVLRRFQSELSRDYKKLNMLLDQALEGEGDELALERTMLEAHFRCMSMLFSLGGYWSERLARRTLFEMLQIVEHHANVFGERTGAAPSRR